MLQGHKIFETLRGKSNAPTNTLKFIINPVTKNKMSAEIKKIAYPRANRISTYTSMRPQANSYFYVTISEKSAMPENPFSTPSIRPRCAPRTASSGSSTITLSKNASTTGRSEAISAKAGR